MAGEPAQKKRRLPFKPPSRAPSSSAGPSTAKAKSKPRQSTTKSSSVASTSKQARNKSKSSSNRPHAESPPAAADASDDDSGSQSDDSNHSRERSLSQEPDYILAEIITNTQSEDVSSSDPAIPPKLLTKLLHHHFQDDKTKVAKDANGVVAKYVDVFVREAIARAAYERAESGGAGARGVADGFLEVSLSSRLVDIILIQANRSKISRKWRRNLQWISNSYVLSVILNESRLGAYGVGSCWIVISRHQIP